MVKSFASNPPPVVNRSLMLGLRIVLIGTLLVSGLITLVIWLVPADVFQNWAYEWAEVDDFRQFEAVGQAEFACWLTRVIAPLIAITAFRSLRRLPWAAVFVANSFVGGLKATQFVTYPGIKSPWRSIVIRTFCFGWIILALGHDWQTIKDCATNWPYFDFDPAVRFYQISATPIAPSFGT